MDIKVITRHAPVNYGSLLQSIATVKLIEQLGHSCEIIDYIREDEKGLKAVVTALKCKKNWNSSILKRIVYILSRYPEEHAAELKFEKMRFNYLKLTKRCTNKKELSELQADIFMTGSDQVWGPTLNGKYDESYFLTFVRKKPKIAFAASFGRTLFTDSIIEKYKQFLSEYTAITVREDAAVNLLNKWNVHCDGQVLDPTLILSASDWNKYVNTINVPNKYVLIYQIHNDKRLGYYAKQFAKRVGLPLIRISPFFHQGLREGKLVLLPDVGEFLSYIKHCTYLITDSFHGTAFALNFNKNFIEVLPNTSTASRNLSILHLTGLENRIVSDFNDFSLMNKQINYDNVNPIIDSQRKNSLEMLKSILSALSL